MTRARSSKTTSADARNPLGNAADFFGNSLGLGYENLIVIGATGDDENGSQSGSMFTFIDSGGWSMTQKRSGKEAGDLYGSSVSHGGRTSIAGTRLDNFGAVNAGTATVFINFGSQLIITVLAASDAAANDILETSVDNDSCWFSAGAMGNDELGSSAGAVHAYTVRAHHATKNGNDGVPGGDILVRLGSPGHPHDAAHAHCG